MITKAQTKWIAERYIRDTFKNSKDFAKTFSENILKELSWNEFINSLNQQVDKIQNDHGFHNETHYVFFVTSKTRTFYRKYWNDWIALNYPEYEDIYKFNDL